MFPFAAMHHKHAVLHLPISGSRRVPVVEIAAIEQRLPFKGVRTFPQDLGLRNQQGGRGTQRDGQQQCSPYDSAHNHLVLQLRRCQ